jgi:hypothetical protein
MKNSRCISKLLVVGLAVLVTGPTSEASTFLIDATDSGQYSSEGDHAPGNFNYVTGNTSDRLQRRNFFVFALPATLETILSAELRLTNPGPPNPGYQSDNSSETYVLRDVSTSITNLMAGGSGLTAIYQDLGTGTTYGSVVVSAASNGTIVTITLNESFISAAQAIGGGGFIALGGALSTLDSDPKTTEFVFGFTGASLSQSKLALTTIPEPATVVLISLALGAVLLRRTRTAQRA